MYTATSFSRFYRSQCETVQDAIRRAGEIARSTSLPASVLRHGKEIAVVHVDGEVIYR